MIITLSWPLAQLFGAASAAGLGLKGLGLCLLASLSIELLRFLGGFRPLPHVSRCPYSISVERCDPPSLVGAVSTALSLLSIECFASCSAFLLDSYLVDPASSHMLVSKIKPCMSQFTLSHGETANGSLNRSRFLR